MAGEETVLYTAQAYMDAQPNWQQQQAAQQALAGLVRCPHLSPCWILAMSRADSEQQLLWPLRDKLAELSAYTMVQQTFNAKTFVVSGSLPDSWLQGPRTLKTVPSSRVTWRLPVSRVKEACIEARAKQKEVIINSHIASPPQRGLSFSLILHCAPTENSSGTQVKLGVGSVNCRNIMFYRFQTHIKLAGKAQTFPGISRGTLPAKLGFEAFLGLGPMAGGWDEAAWAKAGLPTTGELEITAILSVEGIRR